MRSVLARLQVSERHVHSTMGPLVLDHALHPATLYTGHELLPALRGGAVWAMQRGLVYTDPRLGSLVVDFELCVRAAELRRLPAREGTRPGMLLCLTVGPELVPYGVLHPGPGPLPAERRIAVECHGDDMRAWAHEVADGWRASLAACAIPVTVGEGLPEHVPSWLLCSAEAPAAAAVRDCRTDPEWGELLRRYQALDGVQHRPLRRCAWDEAAAAPSGRDAGGGLAGWAGGSDSDGGVWDAHVFVGQPGCDKRGLVAGLVSLSGGAWRTAHYYNAADPASVDPDGLLSAVSAAVSAPAGGGPRLLAVAVSTYANAAAVARALCVHPAARRLVRLRRISAVVNAGSYMVAGGGRWRCGLGADRIAAGHVQAGFASQARP